MGQSFLEMFSSHVCPLSPINRLFAIDFLLAAHVVLAADFDCFGICNLPALNAVSAAYLVDWIPLHATIS